MKWFLDRLVHWAASGVWTMLPVMLFMLSAPAKAEPIIYVGDSIGELGKVDVATGNVTLVGRMATTMTDIAFDPSGNLWALSFTDLYKVDATTGSSTRIGSHSVPSGNALVFGQDGTLYAAGSSANLYTINTSTGQGTYLGNIGYYSAGDLAFFGDNLYLTSTSNHLISFCCGKYFASL